MRRVSWPGDIGGWKQRSWSYWEKTQNSVWDGLEDWRTAFLVLFLTAIHLAWLVGCILKPPFVSFQIERGRMIEIRFFICLVDLAGTFHKQHSFKVCAGGQLHSVLEARVKTRSWFAESNRCSTKALGNETSLTFIYFHPCYKATCAILHHYQISGLNSMLSIFS